MDIFSDGYMYPWEVVTAIVLFLLLFWLAVRATRRSERRYLRARVAAKSGPPLPEPQDSELP
jgi:hypothetical protein